MNTSRLKNTSWWMCLSLSISLGLPIFTRAEDAKPTPKPADTHVQKGELSERMSDVEDLYKKLRRSIRKADTNAESLETIAKIQALMGQAKAMTPAWAAKMPEADRAKFVASYRDDMTAAIAQFDEMATAIKASDNAKAGEIYKKITAMQDAGHEKYIEEKKK